MGKAVPRLIKQRSKELMKSFPEKCSKDFEQNKEFLKGLQLPFSKTEINLMSGFIARTISGRK